nr:transposase [Corynebacterium lactis]
MCDYAEGLSKRVSAAVRGRGSRVGKTREEVAAEYGISSSALTRWVAKAQGTQGTGRGSHLRKADPNSQDPAEMAKRIRELELEKELLKESAPCVPRGSRRQFLPRHLALRQRRRDQAQILGDHDGKRPGY